MLLSPTLPQYASPYEGEEGWSWAFLNKMLHFFLQLFPNPSLHKGRECYMQLVTPSVVATAVRTDTIS